MFRRAIFVAPLVGALVLAGCGGGGTAQMQDHQAGQGIAVGEPNGSGQASAPVTANFIKMAQQSGCTDTRNRLFVIDGKQVLWDRVGKCPDNSYAQILYGAAPDQVLCSVSDSIGGPRTFCADDKSRALFDTIQKNLDKPDLGLAGHKVEQLSFLPKPGTEIAFQNLASDTMSGVTVARTAVVRDTASFEKLWSEHGSNRATAPGMPKVDFSHQMVLAVFSGLKPSVCGLSVSILRVAAGDGKLAVEYAERELERGEVCAAVVTTPMQMVVVERSDAPVEFVPVKAGAVAFKSIDQSSRSGVREPRSVVVKDAAKWAGLWAEHAGTRAALPAVDFDKQMVIGVFLGTRENGCYSTTIRQVTQFGDKISVLHVDTVPAPGVACTLAITTPAHLIVVDRSDSNVEFATEVSTVK